VKLQTIDPRVALDMLASPLLALAGTHAAVVEITQKQMQGWACLRP